MSDDWRNKFTSKHSEKSSAQNLGSDFPAWQLFSLKLPPQVWGLKSAWRKIIPWTIRPPHLSGFSVFCFLFLPFGNFLKKQHFKKKRVFFMLLFYLLFALSLLLPILCGVSEQWQPASLWHCAVQLVIRVNTVSSKECQAVIVELQPKIERNTPVLDWQLK